MAKNKRHVPDLKPPRRGEVRPLVDLRTLVLLTIATAAGLWSAGSTKVSTGLTVAIAVFVVLLDITRI